MTKTELTTIAEKYDMQPCVNNAIENLQEGYYLQSAVCIPELDDLAKRSDLDPVIATAAYVDGGKLGCLYKLIAPQSWF